MRISVPEKAGKTRRNPGTGFPGSPSLIFEGNPALRGDRLGDIGKGFRLFGRQAAGQDHRQQAKDE